MADKPSAVSRRTVALWLILIALLAYCVYDQWPRSTERVFTEIYADKIWGGNAHNEGHSGSGSTMEATVVYRAYLRDFFEKHRIRSVVDAGCGDWEFSQAVDWSGIDYKGYDIVPAVIANNQRKHGAANIQFFTANIVEVDLPAADLLICRHVLQHLPNRDVVKFCAQLPKYKHVLLTSSVEPDTLSAVNVDIAAGDYRTLDVTRPPFSLPGKKVLTYWDGTHMQQVVHLGK